MASITFINRDGSRRTVEAKPGQTLLDIAHQYGVDLEGACEGSLSCSTCHLVVDPTWFGRLPEPSEEELDMLDLASGLTRTSRLGCQVVVDKSLDGLVLSLPGTVRNMALSE